MNRGRIDERHLMGGNEIESNLKKAARNKKKFAKISPSIEGRVHVKGSTYMIPKEDLKTEADVESWRQRMIEKFKL